MAKRNKSFLFFKLIFSLIFLANKKINKKNGVKIPIYNDRESLTKLIENINSEIKDLNSEISIVVINDASSHQIIDDYQNTENINSIEIINMKENR